MIRTFIIVLLLAFAQGLRAQNGISFLVIGDWGTGGRGARQVGQAMASQHAEKIVQAVISTGDNFYPSGVKSVGDPQWQSKFEKIYPSERLPVPFWAVLGNHDFRGEADAQVAYTGKTLTDGSVTRWHMPGQCWSTVFHSGDGRMSILLVGINTRLLVGNRAARTDHLRWIDSVLSASKADYKLVAGHHPVYSHGHYGDSPVMVRNLAPLLEKHGVAAYFNGHEHDLQLIRRINGVRYVISGGGSGKRKTTPGKNTEFAASSLGFFRLDFDADNVQIRMFDSAGILLHEAIDKRIKE